MKNSDTLRDLLNRMARLDLISSITLWMQIRDVRNRIVHDYLPQDIQDLYDTIITIFGKELLNLKKILLHIILK